MQPLLLVVSFVSLLAQGRGPQLAPQSSQRAAVTAHEAVTAEPAHRVWCWRSPLSHTHNTSTRYCSDLADSRKKALGSGDAVFLHDDHMVFAIQIQSRTTQRGVLLFGYAQQTTYRLRCTFVLL